MEVVKSFTQSKIARSLYLQDRANKINNNQRGRLEVIYKDEENWEEIDNK